MRAIYVFFAILATILALCDASKIDTLRSLRSRQHTGDFAAATENDERAFSFKSIFGAKKAKIPDDFAVDKLKLMLRSKTLKNNMFQVWDGKYSVGQIRAWLKLDKSPGYTKLLLSYLNDFKRSTGLRK
ncbi:hypothetical protein PHYSODRAFT_343134 [Phytophthora sojae]|uniref:RxLR effector protein n=1 Tax=Phytophthora sojae (strain P6497) TaxID=1094619 RepID=G5AIQ7_PHYSP|nr:hypothetical protein PHYSODRAFT_343134 [Phytophthora sojae]EGZ04583.1 hypothetical protein PHYSODRAFT_343134 [Phytophthora sojae]|eukprot:XP_009539958.1 hypothetical protein PHYSODRAFT_343134 [Phytophthora sojae]